MDFKTSAFSDPGKTTIGPTIEEECQGPPAQILQASNLTYSPAAPSTTHIIPLEYSPLTEAKVPKGTKRPIRQKEWLSLVSKVHGDLKKSSFLLQRTEFGRNVWREIE